MYDLPLFPLNSVLFPGMPLSLHIFEDRYKEMIEDCLSNQQPFGVVLIQEGHEALGPLPEPYRIGCTAQITQVERLEDGRMNLLAIGMDRFEIQSLMHHKSYLMGTVENLPVEALAGQVVTRQRDLLRPWVERYLSSLAEVSGETEFDPHRLPNDPMALAYLGASLLQIPPVQKQELLTTTDAAALLEQTRTLFRRELPLLRIMIDHIAEDETGLFSAN